MSDVVLDTGEMDIRRNLGNVLTITVQRLTVVMLSRQMATFAGIRRGCRVLRKVRDLFTRGEGHSTYIMEGTVGSFFHPHPTLAGALDEGIGSRVGEGVAPDKRILAAHIDSNTTRSTGV